MYEANKMTHKCILSDIDLIQGDLIHWSSAPHPPIKLNLPTSSHCVGIRN